MDKKLKVAIMAEPFQNASLNPYLGAVDLMRSVGYNFGNLAFWHATYKILSEHPCKRFSWDSKPDEFYDVDVLVFPCANWLNENQNLGGLAQLVREVDKPVLVFGLGAQADTEEKPPRLPEGTIQFLREVSLRTPNLFVRGDFSKKLVESVGIRNVIVGACPSVMVNSNPNLGRVIQEKLNKVSSLNERSFAIHGACRSDQAIRGEKIFFQWLKLYKGDYIVQEPISLVKVLLNEELIASEVEDLKIRAITLEPNENPEAVISLLKKHAIFFNDISSWILRLRQYEITVNTRIHGSLLSIAAETPGICFYHDTRTKELCEATMIPALSVQKFEQIGTDLPELIRTANFSGERFDNNRRELAGQYASIMEKSGLLVPDFLRNLAE